MNDNTFGSQRRDRGSDSNLNGSHHPKRSSPPRSTRKDEPSRKDPNSKKTHPGGDETRKHTNNNAKGSFGGGQRSHQNNSNNNNDNPNRRVHMGGGNRHISEDRSRPYSRQQWRGGKEGSGGVQQRQQQPPDASRRFHLNGDEAYQIAELPSEQCFAAKCNIIIPILENPITDATFILHLSKMMTAMPSDASSSGSDASGAQIGKLIAKAQQWIQQYHSLIPQNIADKRTRANFATLLKMIFTRADKTQSFLSAVSHTTSALVKICTNGGTNDEAGTIALLNEIAENVRKLLPSHVDPRAASQATMTNGINKPRGPRGHKGQHFYRQNDGMLRVTEATTVPEHKGAVNEGSDDTAMDQFNDMNGIVVDATIPPSDAHLHIKALFHLTKADYAMGMEEAMGIACKVLKPHLQRAKQRREEDALKKKEGQKKNNNHNNNNTCTTSADRDEDISSLLFDQKGGKAMLLPHIHRELRAADTHRVCRLYNRLTTQNVRLVRGCNGVVLTVRIDMSQFPPNSNLFSNGKRLAHGNLIALSREWFTNPQEDIIFGVIHRSKPPQSASGASNLKNKDINMLSLILEIEGVDKMEQTIAVLRTNPTFQALESTSLFIPTQRVLESLRQQQSDSDKAGVPLSLPLDNCILTGETNTTPQYLIASRSGLIRIDKAVLLRNTSNNAPSVANADGGLYSVDAKNITTLVQPWTHEMEQKLAAYNKVNKRHVHVLDDTQAVALQHILTHRVAIVQGTPGTGKTFIGGKFVQLLLENISEGIITLGGPILVLAQTNHAVDAVLEDIIPHIKACSRRHGHGLARLGNQSADKQNNVVAEANEYSGRRSKGPASRWLFEKLDASFELFETANMRIRETLECIEDAGCGECEDGLKKYGHVFKCLNEQFRKQNFGCVAELKLANDLRKEIEQEMETRARYDQLARDRYHTCLQQIPRQAAGTSPKTTADADQQITLLHRFHKSFEVSEVALVDFTRNVLDTIDNCVTEEELETDDRVKQYREKILTAKSSSPSFSFSQNRTINPSLESTSNEVGKLLIEFSALFRDLIKDHERVVAENKRRINAAVKELEQEKKKQAQKDQSAGGGSNNKNKGQGKKGKKGGGGNGGAKNKQKLLAAEQNQIAAKISAKESELSRLQTDQERLDTEFDSEKKARYAKYPADFTNMAKQIAPLISKMKPPTKLSLETLTAIRNMLVEIDEHNRALLALREKLKSVDEKIKSLDVRLWRNGMGILSQDEFQSVSNFVQHALFGFVSSSSASNTILSTEQNDDTDDRSSDDENKDEERESRAAALEIFRREEEANRVENFTDGAFDIDSEAQQDVGNIHLFIRDILRRERNAATNAQKKATELLATFAEKIKQGEDTSRHREVIFQFICWTIILKSSDDIKAAVTQVALSRQAIRDAEDKCEAEHLKSFLVVGATTIGCAGSIGLMKKLRPKIVIVEEAAEVLESHVVACLTEGAEHLVLIGDHKQLQPKVENESTIGRRKHLNVSLMERMVRMGAEYVTLTTQRRMHSDISEFHKQYYLDADETRFESPAKVNDHPSTELIPVPRGVANGSRVVLLAHSGKDRCCESYDEGLQSFFNEYESLFALAVFVHVQRCNPSATITLIVPYLAHVFNVHRLMSSKRIKMRRTASGDESLPNNGADGGGLHADVTSRGLRVASIDNYQGEEDDFIILCLTRTSPDGIARSFLNMPNRACVALSRARRGMFVIGCEEAIRGASNPMWGTFLSILERRANTNPHALCRPSQAMGCAQFPAVCPVHNTIIPPFSSLSDLDTISRCDKLCSVQMSCGHACTNLCHPGSSTHSKCAVRCERLGHACIPPRECSHACSNKCSDRCGACEVKIQRTCKNKDCGSVKEYPCRGMATKYVDSCSEMIVGTALCGHTVTATCREWVNGTQECKTMCEKRMPCGHMCTAKCHHGTDDDHQKALTCCRSKRTVKHPTCREHDITVICNTPIKAYPPCEEPCGGVAPCGHPCKAQCHGTSVHVCTMPSPRLLDACGHTALIPCNVSTSDAIEGGFLCKAPCPFVHGCGHTCGGTCSSCHNNSPFALDHVPCGKVCGKKLLCGHSCQGSCSHEECPPCSIGCNLSCGHGAPCDGTHSHGDCTNCQSDCLWNCTHHTCEKRCFQLCDRPVCEEPCPRSSAASGVVCAHTDVPCAGVCGEVCPQFCSKCFAEQEGGQIEDSQISGVQSSTASADNAGGRKGYEPASRFVSLGLLLADDKERKMCLSGDFSFLANEVTKDSSSTSFTPASYRLVALPCCGSFFLSGELDAWVTTKFRYGNHADVVGLFEEEDGILSSATAPVTGPIECPNPKCCAPMMPNYYRRKANLIRQRWAEVSRVLQEENSLRAMAMDAALEGEEISPCDFVRQLFATLMAEEEENAQDNEVLAKAFEGHLLELTSNIEDICAPLESKHSNRKKNKNRKSQNNNNSTENVVSAISQLRAQAKTIQLKLGELFTKCERSQWPASSSVPLAPANNIVAHSTALTSIILSQLSHALEAKRSHDAKQAKSSYLKLRALCSVKMGVYRLGLALRTLHTIQKSLGITVARGNSLHDSSSPHSFPTLNAELKGLSALLDEVVLSETNTSCTLADSNLQRITVIAASIPFSAEITISLAKQIRGVIFEDRRKRAEEEKRRRLMAMAAAASNETPIHIAPRRHSICKEFLDDLQSGARDFVTKHAPFFRGKGAQNQLILNPCVKNSCSAAQRFLIGFDSIAYPRQSDQTRRLSSVAVTFAFHGTASGAIAPICCRGFDVKRRKGQAHGAGEYFALNPTISEGYAKGSEAMLVCAIIEPKRAHPAPIVSRPVQDFVVVNNPITDTDCAFVIPVGIATWRKSHAAGDAPFSCSYPSGDVYAPNEEDAVAAAARERSFIVSARRQYDATQKRLADVVGWLFQCSSRRKIGGLSGGATDQTEILREACHHIRRAARIAIQSASIEDDDDSDIDDDPDGERHPPPLYTEESVEEALNLLSVCNKITKDLPPSSSVAKDTYCEPSIKRDWFVCSTKRHIFSIVSSALQLTLRDADPQECPLCSTT